MYSRRSGLMEAFVVALLFLCCTTRGRICPVINSTHVFSVPNTTLFIRSCEFNINCPTSAVECKLSGILQPNERISLKSDPVSFTFANGGLLNNNVFVSSPMKVVFASNGTHPHLGFSIQYACSDKVVTTAPAPPYRDPSISWTASATLVDPPPPRMTEADQEYFLSLTVLALGAGLPAMETISEIQYLVLMGNGKCANEILQSVAEEQSMWVVKPLEIGPSSLAALLGYFAIVYGQLILHTTVVGVVACIRKTSARESMIMCFFPNWPYYFGSLFATGFAYQVFVVIANVSADSLDVVGMLLAVMSFGYLFLLTFGPKRFALDMLAIRFVKYKLENIGAVPRPIRKLFLPAGYWKHQVVLRTHRSMFAFCKNDMTWFAFIPTLRSVLVALISSLDFARSGRCWLQGVILICIWSIMLFLVAGGQPHRIPLSVMCQCLTHMSLIVVSVCYMLPDNVLLARLSKHFIFAVPILSIVNSGCIIGCTLLEKLLLIPRQEAFNEVKVGKVAEKQRKMDSRSQEEVRADMLALEEISQGLLVVTPQFHTEEYDKTEGGGQNPLDAQELEELLAAENSSDSSTSSTGRKLEKRSVSSGAPSRLEMEWVRRHLDRRRAYLKTLKKPKCREGDFPIRKHKRSKKHLVTGHDREHSDLEKEAATRPVDILEESPERVKEKEEDGVDEI